MAATLASRRARILGRWLAAARRLSFHADQPEQAIADHLPTLFDALVARLAAARPRARTGASAAADRAVHDAAAAHARARFQLGLAPPEVLTEFRLLRREIGRALRAHPGERDDLIAAEVLVHDTLDEAAVLALASLGAQAEERQRLQEELAAIVESSSDAVVSTTLDGVITSWNAAAERLYGYLAQEALGQPIALILPPERAAEAPAIRQRIRLGERVEPFETERARKHGGRVAVRLSVWPVRDAAGAVVGCSAVAHDLTEQQRAEAERDLLLEALAHDLRSPLTVIIGTAELLHRQARSGGPNPDRLVERLASIVAAAGTIADRLTALLDVARLRAGEPLALVRCPTDLVALARRAAARAQATTDDHLIRVEAAAPELVGRWDAARIERVLDNLLGNAVKYSPAGGPIMIAVGPEDRAGRRWARLTVCDRGVGIPASDRAHVFERYHRGANAVGRFLGEGIGLAGACQIVEQHGGTLAVESQEGLGSTFTVRLPL